MNSVKSISVGIAIALVSLFKVFSAYGSCCNMTAKLDSYVQTYVDQGLFSGAVLVAKDGKILLSKGYGMANYEHMVPNKPDTKFHIGSMTKQFTSMAIMQLVQAGKLKLSDIVACMLPEYPINKEITVYHLLTMTSGLPDYLNDVKDFDVTKPTTLNKILASIKYEPLHFTPGSKYRYCNTGYMLLRAIIEKLSKKDYEIYLQDHIFGPLGMKNSGVLHNRPLIPHRAQGYDLATKKLENATCFDPSCMIGTGGLYSTVEDLYLWDRALYTDKLLSADLRKQLWQPNLAGYCLGWQRGNLDGHEFVFHGGDTDGCSTKIVRFIDDDMCIIVLGNLSDIQGMTNYMASPVNRICSNAAAIIFGKNPHMAVKIDPALYDAYIGQYELDAGDKKVIFTVIRDQDTLFFQPPEQKPFKIWPASKTKFFNDDETWLNLSFVKDTTGNVTGLKFYGDDKKIIAKKISAQSPWQRSVDQKFAAKKSGQFKAKDKTGASVILEWHKTNVHEPAYVDIMRSVSDLFIRAFVPNEIRFLKAHPEAVAKAEQNDPYKQFAPLFERGVESVDWKAVEKKWHQFSRSYWEKQASGEDVSKRYANSIFLFVIAKDALTNNVLGFVCYRIDDDDPQGAVIIEPLAVAPEAQTRGLGKLLTSSIFKFLPDVTRIGLTVECKNEIALKAYQVWGFVEFQAPDAYHKNMEYRAEKSDILQKIARTLM